MSRGAFYKLHKRRFIKLLNKHKIPIPVRLANAKIKGFREIVSVIANAQEGGCSKFSVVIENIVKNIASAQAMR